MTEVVRLTYISRRPAASRDSAATEVWQILQAARRANPALNISGALFANASYFAQVLEGPAQKVDEQFAYISSDPRHFDVEVLERVVVPERLFPNWSMGFASLDIDAADGSDGVFEDAFRTPGNQAAIVVRALIERSISDLAIS